MVRAAVDGAIDFSRDLRDPLVLQNIMWRLDEIDRRDWVLVLERLHARHLAYMICPKIDGLTATGFAEKEARTLDRIMAKVFNTGQTKTDRRARKAAELRNAWARVFGDPRDPKVQAKIQATARALLQQGLRR